jgi:predicted unusual protein kinase regulating ubiquinone biosynthesis (AarF/ABC1/UbiB family)
MDAGMVIKLDENDRKNFINLIKHLICHEGEKCAEMIYNLSSFKG